MGVYERWKAAFLAACLLHAVLFLSLFSVSEMFRRVHEIHPVVDVSLIRPVLKPPPVPGSKNQKISQTPERPPEVRKAVAPKNPVRSKSHNKKVEKKSVKKVHKRRAAAPPVSAAKKKISSKKDRPVKQVKRSPKKVVKKVDNEELLSASLAAMKKKVETERLQQAKLNDRLSAIAERVKGKKGAALQGKKADAPGGLDVATVYGRVLKNRIRGKWFYPAALFNARGLKVTISLKVARDGRLISLVFEEKSGNPLFDDSVERAVKAAAPFPPLPADLLPGPWEAGFNFDIEEM